jgi:tetratricopeptide (TPR) repeat protein
MASPDTAGRLGWIVSASVVGLLACAFALSAAVAGAAQKQGLGQERTIQPAPCRAGDALLALGRLKAAEATFEGALGTGATVRCAREGLAKIGHEHPCAGAKALLRSGEKAEANKAYLESLAAKPAKECAAAGVEESSEPSHWDDLRTVSSDMTTTLEFALLGLACLLMLVLLALLLIRFWPNRRRIKRWRTALRSCRRPAVSIETLDDAGLKDRLGVGTAALLRENIELGSGPGALKLVSGEATAATSWVSKVSEIGEQGKILAAVIGLFYLLWPRPHVKVTGTLQPTAQPDGPGISLELNREGDSRGSTTFWASRFRLPEEDGDVAAIRRLAVPAAAWVSHKITRETEEENRAAKNPFSWALFKSGIESQRARELDQAARVYEEALAIDQSNYGALANLALIEAGLGNYVRAIPRLREALVRLELG